MIIIGMKEFNKIKKCNMIFSNPTNLKYIISQMSNDILDLMKKMLKWIPNNRMNSIIIKSSIYNYYIISQVVSYFDNSYSKILINISNNNNNGVKRFSNKNFPIELILK